MKSSTTNTIRALILFLVLSGFSVAQELNSGAPDSTSADSDKFEMKKSPWGAVLRSALLPGLGQIYNESYWKVPVIWGVTGWFVYAWADNNNKYIDNKNIYAETGIDRNRRLRDFYRDQRDEFAIYLAVTYLLNLIDAYVDAHLFDFSVGENFFTGQRMFNVRIQF